jgi:TPR repeat protein
VVRDYAEALRWYRKAADQGDPDAQYGLGLMYSLGQGVAQDYAESARWLHKAADQGNASAEYGLGRMYHEGRGLSQNDREAVGWYRKAADQGDADAQRALGFSNTGWTVGRKFQYLAISIVFLGGLYFATDFLLSGRGLRHWRQKAKVLAGTSAMLWAGLSLYGLIHLEIRYAACVYMLYLAKGLLVGTAIAMFICLGMTTEKPS